MKIKLLRIGLLIIGSLLCISCKELPKEPIDKNNRMVLEGDNSNTDSIQVPENIIEILYSKEDFSTLLNVLKAGGLIDTLRGPGFFTVFAPVNAAFDKLPEGVLERLGMPMNQSRLVALLNNHIVSGMYSVDSIAREIVKNEGVLSLTTVQGGIFNVFLKDGKIRLTDEHGTISTLITHDIAASNGIIHAVDRVVMLE